MLNGLDLFSGIGGLSLALSPWVQPLAYCENDRYAQSILLSRMQSRELTSAPIWDDITTFVPELLPGEEIDIIYGGFPCQDISIAGAGAGLGGSRSKLFFEVVRLISEIRPKFVFLENVPAISIRGLDRILLEFTTLRYDCRWTIVSAAEMGAPHLRERWFLLAHANGTGFQEPWPESSEERKNKKPKRPSSFSMVQGKRWNESPSKFYRMDDGIRLKTHRIRALGNAVVPCQARKAFEKLVGLR